MIQYREYGLEGPRISRLGYGVMRLPTRAEDGANRVDFDASTHLLQTALEQGINFLDSHHGYHGGDSERAIGKALAGWRGQRVIIQTKTPWYQEEPREHFERLLYAALEKLGVDCIDYLLHHSLRMPVWQARGREFIKFTDWAMNRGLIRQRGFSSHDTPENIRAFVDTGEFAVMLVSCNWMNPVMRDTIAYAADRGMGVSVMNPVGGGALATPTPPIMRLLPGARSAAEIALRYVLAMPGVTATLSGMNTLEQVRDNGRVASRKTPLTALQSARMQARLARLERAAREFCTACGYCLPCPHGVAIASNFSLLNQARFFGRTAWARTQLERLREHPDGDRSYAACRRCGLCEPKCPNNVPIMRQLEEVGRELGSEAWSVKRGA